MVLETMFIFLICSILYDGALLIWTHLQICKIFILNITVNTFIHSFVFTYQLWWYSHLVAKWWFNFFKLMFRPTQNLIRFSRKILKKSTASAFPFSFLCVWKKLSEMQWKQTRRVNHDLWSFYFTEETNTFGRHKHLICVERRDQCSASEYIKQSEMPYFCHVFHIVFVCFN